MAGNALLQIDDEGKTCLFAACSSGSQPIAEMIYRLGGSKLLAIQDNEGLSCAHAAASAGHVAVVRTLYRLMNGGVPLMLLRDKRGRCAMGAAAAEGRDAVVFGLFTMGVPLDNQDGNGETPAQIAASGGHHSVLQMLYELGRSDLLLARTPAGASCMQLARKNGHKKCMIVLQQHGIGAIDEAIGKEGGDDQEELDEILAEIKKE